MEDFADVSRARESYKLFADAMVKGRDILVRAGIAPEAPPPIPDFDAVFRRLDAGLRPALFSQLRPLNGITTEDAIRIWQPLIRQAFGLGQRSPGRS